MVKKNDRKMSLFDLIKGSILNPVTSVEGNVLALENTKNTFTFAGIITLVITIANMLSTMITTIFAKECDWWTNKCSFHVSFGNLDSLDYVYLIIVSLIKYAVMVLAIAGVYYIGSLILKKSANYVKTLALVSFAVIPSIIANFAASIFGIVYQPLAILVGTIGSIYTILILCFNVKAELKINDIDKLILFNSIVLAIVKLLEYFVF